MTETTEWDDHGKQAVIDKIENTGAIATRQTGELYPHEDHDNWVHAVEFEDGDDYYITQDDWNDLLDHFENDDRFQPKKHNNA